MRLENEIFRIYGGLSFLPEERNKRCIVLRLVINQRMKKP
jgi:hypothetical protein